MGFCLATRETLPSKWSMPDPRGGPQNAVNVFLRGWVKPDPGAAPVFTKKIVCISTSQSPLAQEPIDCVKEAVFTSCHFGSRLVEQLNNLLNSVFPTSPKPGYIWRVKAHFYQCLQISQLSKTSKITSHKCAFLDLSI